MVHLIFLHYNIRSRDNFFLSAIEKKIASSDRVVFIYTKNDSKEERGEVFRQELFASFILMHGLEGYFFLGSIKACKDFLITHFEEQCIFYEDEREFIFPLLKNISYKLFRPFFSYHIKHNFFETLIFPRPLSFQIFKKHNMRKKIKNDTLVLIEKKKEDISQKEYLEDEVHKKWQFFLKKKLSFYVNDRNNVDINGTSELSRYIHPGVISVKRIWVDSLNLLGFEKAKKFLEELVWRDFAYHVFYWYPHLKAKNTNEKNIHNYLNNPDFIKAWKAGKTGYDIIDAAMYQLSQTGWIHNRLRMVVACFLVKNLHIDWRIGAQHFMESLIDGDEVVNAFSWQWVAGVGVDYMESFRIFNPDLQAKRFDPEGKYRQDWLRYKGERIVDYKKSKEVFLAEVVSKK
jgi:deoxyribodipyrimidine photolyase